MAPESLSADWSPWWLDAGFLVGSWVATATDGSQTEEHWTQARGGSMLGIGREFRRSNVPDGGDRLEFYEFLRIESRPDGLVYLASPNGRCPPTEFKRVQKPGDRFHLLVFENPAHDFPTRIIYRDNSDGTMTARIEGTKDGKPASEEWRFHRAALR